MGEEWADEQLKDFCRRHGLAKDGYLDETELNTVCKCIGIQVSSEMIAELFQELDSDKDGQICLSELSQMLRGMQDKLPPSPEKQNNKVTITNLNVAENTTPPRPIGKGSNGLTNNISVHERGAFSVLDPDNTGFAKVGLILDLWSQLGISETDGCRLLADLGFSANSKSHSINLQDLAKSVEDEIDHSKERLPLAFQVALVTYRTEAQFLKSLCESIECERDKLKADIHDAHQRSAVIAQEVDEQNARMERNSQVLIRKIELKYNEQIQELQNRFSSEKESLQQALHVAETKLKELQDEDSKLKTKISKLNEENTTLEKELHNVNIEIRNLNRVRSQLEREVSRFIGLENQLQDVERKYVDSLANSDGKLKDSYSEIQALRDQNDELTMQLEAVRETLKLVEATQTKEKRCYVHKKRKGGSSLNHRNHNNCSSTSTSSSSVSHNQCDGRECSSVDGEGMPVNKMCRYYSQHDEAPRSIEDTDDCDSSLEQVASIQTTTTKSTTRCHKLEHSLPCSTGAVPTSVQTERPFAIRIAACVGESSTDPVMGNGCEGEECEEMESEPSLSGIEERLFLGQTEKDCASLESEICAVEINNLRVQSRFGHGMNKTGVMANEKMMEHKEVQTSFPVDSVKENTTQTDFTDYDSATPETVMQLREQMCFLEKNLEEKKAAYEKENSDLKVQCKELESSLELLREEYEKCEDYWHEKLQEARETYEQDKTDVDEKFHDLLLKIKEYEELVVNSPITNPAHDRLPPIEERASLERQVTDLEDECEVLRTELKSARMEQDSVITTYQRSFETKLKEECANLEHQVSALSKKCQDYESRLSALAEEERSTVEESGMVDMMKERIKHLELQLRSQEDKFRQQINLLEITLKEREILYKKSIPDIPKPLSPQFGQTFGQNNWNNNDLIQSKSKSLLEMLHNSHKPESIWPQRYASVGGDKSSSLPFIPAADHTFTVQTGAWGSLSPPFQPEHASSWGVPPPGSVPTMKKAWCHVELGWLQSLRAKLKQRDEQCYHLQRALQQKDSQTEKIITELKYRHEMEIANWESLMQASQELLRQHVIKHKEQAEKLAHSDLLMKDLWVENAKLMAALNSTEQRVIQLENLLKFQMTTAANSHQNQHNHHQFYSSMNMPMPHGSPINNNHNGNPTTNAIMSAPLSLPHQSSHFNV